MDSYKAIKIRSMSSFGGKVKPLCPCCKILRYGKEPFEIKRDISLAKFISFAVCPVFLLDASAGRNAREVWWTNQEFPPVDIIPP
jgi:hypothetical protein